MRAAQALIGASMAKRVLVVGFEATASHLAADDVRLLYGLSFDVDIEGFAGANATALYALSMRLHMQRHAQFAQVAVQPSNGPPCQAPAR